MTENPEEQPGLGDELTNLGNNLRDMMKAMWNSPDRTQVQQEIETGLKDLGTTLDQAIDSLSNTETAQHLKVELEGLRKQFEENKTRQTIESDLVEALRKINAEVGNVTKTWESKSSNPPAEATTQDTPPD